MKDKRKRDLARRFEDSSAFFYIDSIAETVKRTRKTDEIIKYIIYSSLETSSPIDTLRIFDEVMDKKRNDYQDSLKESVKRCAIEVFRIKESGLECDPERLEDLLEKIYSKLPCDRISYSEGFDPRMNVDPAVTADLLFHGDGYWAG